MTGTIRCGVGLGCVLALSAATAPAAWSQDRGAAQAAHERLTLDIKDQPLVDVVRYVRSLTGAQILLGEGPHGTRLIDLDPPPVVTVNFEAMPWRDALQRIAESAECRVRRKGDRYVLYRPTLVTVAFERADLRDVVQAIAAQAGANVIIGADVPDGLEVSVRLKDVPWQNALAAVVKSVGMTVVHSKGSAPARLNHGGIVLPPLEPLTPNEQAAKPARRQDAAGAAEDSQAALRARVADAEARVAELQAKLQAMQAKLAELTKLLRKPK